MISIHSIVQDKNEKLESVEGEYAGLFHLLSKYMQYQFSSDCEAVSLEVDKKVYCITIQYLLIIIIY